MNETIHPDGASDVPLAHQRSPGSGADTSMSPGSEKAAPAVVGLLNHAVQGAHGTIDRIAVSAAPAAKQLGERVSAAGDALHAMTDQLRDTRDEWVQSVRTTVRSNPWLPWLPRLRWAP